MGKRVLDYQKYYQQQLKDGIEYQDFVYDQLYGIGLPVLSYSSKKYQLLRGENKPGIEIKYDKKFHATGNLYIEIAEKSSPSKLNFVESGIYRDDNSWLYIIGDRERIFVFSKTILKLLEGRYEHKETATSKGFLVPLADAEKYAAKIIIP